MVGGDEAAAGAFFVLVRRGDFLFVRMVPAHRAILLRHEISTPPGSAYNVPHVATLWETLLAVDLFRFASGREQRL
ncbi:hypothetical protein GCM10009850_064020 [Nonomuraea monospora]|uniref:Uncharacterized protein n=1 Tax=Nonomuraea monospora TaxID=568818 RepID=A0ABP5PGU8_9ACTN